MSKLLHLWVRIRYDRRAVTALEYALIAGLIAAVIAGAVSTLGKNASTMLSAVAGSV